MRQMASSESNVNSPLRLVLTHILGMRKVCSTTVVPNYFPGKRSMGRMQVALLCRHAREPRFFAHIIAGDKSRIVDNDLETKQNKSAVGHQKSGNQEIRNSLRFFCLFVRLFYVWLFLCLLTATNGDTIISGLKPR